MPVYPTSPPAGLIEQPGSPDIEYQPNGMVNVERHYKATNFTTGHNLAPKPGDVDFSFVFLRCYQSKIKQIATGEEAGWADIRASYLGYVWLPPARVELTTNRLDRPIEQHPDWNDNAVFGHWADEGGTPKTRLKDPDALGTTGAFAFKGWMATAPFRGIEAFMVASYQYKVTDYRTTWETPTGLFKRDNPPTVLLPNGVSTFPGGTGAGEPRKWLKVQHDLQAVMFGRTVLFERVQCWLYSDVGWLSQIYADA